MSERFASTCGVLLIICGAAAFAAPPKSVWSGVYTAEQANAGEKLYYDRCATCHGDDLGGVEKAPALVGGTFRDSWDGKTLRKLLERIESMPPDEPKVVSTDEAVNVLAFLLRASEVPAGSAPLPGDRTQLSDIVFERSKP
jgi:quinoprotein glucose dehydrogenase